ncbi:MAG TPA: tryptophan 2,3-dioxygenase [Alphaproteobacteria bacterium]|nr:tryptophan 2,3-dioxygenase [Alphaproteobacteria bacterium]
MTDRKKPDAPDSGAHLDFSGEMSYGDYLALDKILDAQHRLSDNHNELLFIIQHQTTELWMKLVIHELKAAIDQVRRDDLQPAFKMLARVSRIMAQLIQAWDVLSTLTPSEYLAFRERLGHSSGFQSYQYRTIEFLLGNKNAHLVAPHRHRADISGPLEAVLNAPGLYDEAIRLLARRGFSIDPGAIERDWSQPYAASPSVEAAWIEVYRDTAAHWDLYELAEELVDLEDFFRQWRFRHVTTVERVIGFKRGTGGTAGVAYLRKLLDVRLFPELWDLRTAL